MAKELLQEDLVDRLRRENEALNDQVKLLVRTEHRLYRTQNALDRQIARIRDTVSGEDLDDELRHLRFTSLAWWEHGFFYARFPDLPEGDVGLFKDMSVHYHRVGTHQRDDELVFANPDDPELGYDPTEACVHFDLRSDDAGLDLRSGRDRTRCFVA